MTTTQSKTCSGCGYGIARKYISLNGEDWHVTCIFCDQCLAPLFTGQADTTYGKFYCQDCVTHFLTVNIDEILEAIFRPLTEEEIGSLAFQALHLLDRIHNQGKLHNNIKHKTIYINPSGVVTIIDNDEEDESKTGGASIKFKAPEAAISVASDIYSLGVALWTSADYLLAEEEEPALSEDFCEFIGRMTDDEPENRPPIKTLVTYIEKYRDLSTQYLAPLIKEVERKNVLRKEITGKEVKQRQLNQKLWNKIDKGVHLHKVAVASLIPPGITKTNLVDVALLPSAMQTSHQVMCNKIRSFNLKQLHKVDISKLPSKRVQEPRERLLQELLETLHRDSNFTSYHTK